MASVEDGLKQQQCCLRIPPGEAIVLGAAEQGNFEPDVVIIYGNPAQIMKLMCGLQNIQFEQFQFNFIGEGARIDSLGQCYHTGKPAVAVSCYAERFMGQVKDDEIAIALPRAYIDRAIEGLAVLKKIGFGYPISNISGFIDSSPLLASFDPASRSGRAEPAHSRILPS